MAKFVSTKSVDEYDVTYEQLQAQAMELLVRCGQLTLLEHAQQGNHAGTSANEVLGMATRLIAEQALLIQTAADVGELMHG